MAKNLDEAMRLLDRKRLPADLKKVVGNARTRGIAEARLAAHFGEADRLPPQGDDKDAEIERLRAVAGEQEQEPDPDPEPEANPTEDSDEDDTVEDGEYEGWNKADLKAECENRDLPTSGNKGDLVARLEEDDEA